MTPTELAGTVRLVPQERVYGDSYEDVPRRIPDVTRMHRTLGVLARTPLEEGLARTIAWFRGAKAAAGQSDGV